MSGADYDAAAAKAEFYATRGGVRGIVESGSGSGVVTAVPPFFLALDSPTAAATMTVPTVDLSLPRPAAMELVGAAARSGGLFYVTNHGVAVDSALSAVKAFHELPLAVRSPIYSLAPVAGVLYTTMQPTAPASVIPWRDTLHLSYVGPHGAPPDLGRLPSECGDALMEYRRAVSELGKKQLSGLLSEALSLGVGAALVEASTMACHYYPSCPEPARVVGSLDHTDPSTFTVLAQDHVGGLMVRLDGNEAWLDVPPLPGALLVNVGDLLKVVTNGAYKSIEHRVRIKSAEDARVSIAIFFNPAGEAEGGDTHLIGPLPELVTQDMPRRYRSFTMAEFMDSRREFGHGKSSIDGFAGLPESGT